jgi:deazaflavin-dependent oxidoreductase (nitroreductase family)
MECTWTRVHASLYQRTGGRFFPRWFGQPVLVIETTGRRTGKTRATPVIFIRDRGRLIVVAANAGSERIPAWWLNLRASGSAVVVHAGKRQLHGAHLAEGDERQRLWTAFARTFPQLEIYVRFTEREFPVVVLEPAGAGHGRRPDASVGGFG